MKSVRLAVPALLAGSLVAVMGCGTIMHGTNQDIGLASNPSGAKVMLDNHDLGITPVIAKLSRKDNHVVHFALEGYQPTDLTLTRSTSGWVWGNIVFGGVIGLGVDAITGGLYKLTPDQLTATMSKNTASATKGGGLYVTVVMHPDTAWQKIGTLARLDTAK